MPPKKSKADDGTQGGLTKAARFARVRNDLSIGFVGLPNVGKSTVSFGSWNGWGSNDREIMD
jgi:GTPase involved in cell partitioning and DNA repair